MLAPIYKCKYTIILILCKTYLNLFQGVDVKNEVHSLHTVRVVDPTRSRIIIPILVRIIDRTRELHECHLPNTCMVKHFCDCIDSIIPSKLEEDINL